MNQFSVQSAPRSEVTNTHIRPGKGKIDSDETLRLGRAKSNPDDIERLTKSVVRHMYQNKKRRIHLMLYPGGNYVSLCICGSMTVTNGGQE